MNEEPRRLSAYGNKKARRRKPRRYRFVKGLAVYLSVLVVLLAAFAAVFWKYLDLRAERSADAFVEKLASGTEPDGWKQLLRQYLPATYPGYENAAELAYTVLAPSFTVGRVTWLPCATAESRSYMLFSGGRRFAVLALRDASGSRTGLAEWEIDSITFDLGYFSSVEFPLTTVVMPAGASLSVNGVYPAAPSAGSGPHAYPALSAGETGEGPACVAWYFDDIWFAPELSCTLYGEPLELVRSDTDRFYYFRFPERDTHSISVTVPAGVTATVGGKVLTEEWASLSVKEGELGDLDDGGTGTLPMLNIWTVDGLFADTPVAAEVYGESVRLLSSEGYHYVFDTPDACKYKVSVTVPAGAEVRVNGREPDPSTGTRLSASESGVGNTAFGRYDVADLAAVPEAVPAFDRYELTGYLALPNVTVYSGGVELQPCSHTVDEYDAVWEYDYLPSPQEKISASRVAAAQDFVNAYMKYICDGGAWNDPSNSETFNSNYENLKSLMIMGTSGYVSVMESYRTVNMLPHYDSFSLSGLSSDSYVAYTDSCVSCRITCQVLRTVKRTGPDGSVTETADNLSVSMMVLQILYRGEWRVWGFVYN